MCCFTYILFCEWRTEVQKGIGLSLRYPAVSRQKNNAIRITGNQALQRLSLCITKWMKDLSHSTWSPESYYLLALASSTSPRNKGITQRQQDDQKVVAGPNTDGICREKSTLRLLHRLFYYFPITSHQLVKTNFTKWSYSTKQTENVNSVHKLLTISGNQQSPALWWGNQRPHALLTNCYLSSFSALQRILILILENKS